MWLILIVHLAKKTSFEISAKIDNLKEQIEAYENLVGNWDFLDGEGYSDEKINRTLHGLVSGILWTFRKGDESPDLFIIYK